MNLKQCEHGHFYNPALSDTCPVCGGGNNSDAGRTVAWDQQDNSPSEASKTEAVMSPGLGTIGGSTVGTMGTIGWNVGGETVPVSAAQQNFAYTAPDEGKTMPVTPINKNTAGASIDPVTGWLICVDGEMKGQDYRLHDGYNTIGRADNNDVVIKGDEQITREKQAYITYDGQNRAFYFLAGEGRNNLYVNNQLALKGAAILLKPYDYIRMGNSTLLFIPLCTQQFDWADLEEKA